MIRAGELRHRVEFKAKTVTRADNGEELVTMTTVRSAWVKIEPLNGRELFSAQQVNSEISTRIKARYFRGLNPAWEIHYKGHVYNILVPINTNMENTEYVLMCKEVL